MKKPCFYTISKGKKGLILCKFQSIIQVHFKNGYCGEVARPYNIWRKTQDSNVQGPMN